MVKGWAFFEAQKKSNLLRQIRVAFRGSDPDLVHLDGRIQFQYVVLKLRQSGQTRPGSVSLSTSLATLSRVVDPDPVKLNLDPYTLVLL